MPINELEMIVGEYSANPPYTVFEVIGTEITARIKAELGGFGFDDFRETQQGFRALTLNAITLIDQG